jgi:hypothetical protein
MRGSLMNRRIIFICLEKTKCHIMMMKMIKIIQRLARGNKGELVNKKINI